MKKIAYSTLLCIMVSVAAVEQPQLEQSIVEGTIIQSECAPDREHGFLVIQAVRNHTLVSTWYKVHSKELCTKNKTSKWLPEPVTPLEYMAAQNTMDAAQTSRIVLNQEGEVEYANIIGPEMLADFNEHSFVDQEQVSAWFSEKVKGGL